MLAGFVVFAVALYFIAGDSFNYKTTASSTIDAAAAVGEITADRPCARISQLLRTGLFSMGTASAQGGEL